MVHSAFAMPEVKSCTSAASWRESKEAHTARITQSPLHSCTTHTLPCDWMTRDGRRANWIALAPKEGRSDRFSLWAQWLYQQIRLDDVCTSHILHLVGGWRSQLHNYCNPVRSHDWGTDNFLSEGGIRLHAQRFQQDYSCTLEEANKRISLLKQW